MRREVLHARLRPAFVIVPLLVACAVLLAALPFALVDAIEEHEQRQAWIDRVDRMLGD